MLTLFNICGTQSPITVTTLRLVQTIARATVGEPITIQTNNVSALSAAWKNTPPDQRNFIVIYSEAIEADLVQLLVDSNIPTIAAVDDFESIVAFQERNLHQDLITATYQATLGTVQISQLADYDRKFLVKSDIYSKDIFEYAREIIRFFGLTCSEEQFSELKKVLYGDREAMTFSEFFESSFPEWKLAPDYTDFLPTQEREALKSIAAAYDAIASGRPASVIHWPARLFFDGDAPGKPLIGTKLLCGPARSLIYGPYFRLPVGDWECELHVEIRDGRADTIALFDVFNGDVLSAVSMRFPRHGTYSIDTAFTIRESHKPVELRLSLLKGALEGEIRVIGAHLSLINKETRQDSATPRLGMQ